MMMLQPPHETDGAAGPAPSRGADAGGPGAEFVMMPLARATWLALAAVAIVDIGWSILGGFHIVTAGIAAPAFSVLLLAGGGSMLRRLRRNSPAVALLDGVAQILACFALCAVLSYLALSTGRPLIDGTLAALDRAMGFDWPRYVAWIQARPALDGLLFKVYFSPLLELMLATILLGALDRRRLQELSTAMLIALLLTIGVSAIIPALDAYNHYASAHPELVNELGVHDLAPLRQGALREIDLRKVGGLISFPSFHTVLALLFIHALRGIRFVFPASIVLNAAVILSTLTAGGHFLVDLIGGAGLTVVAIAAVPFIERRLAALPTPLLPGEAPYPGVANAAIERA